LHFAIVMHVCDFYHSLVFAMCVSYSSNHLKTIFEYLMASSVNAFAPVTVFSAAKKYYAARKFLPVHFMNHFVLNIASIYLSSVYDHICNTFCNSAKCPAPFVKLCYILFIVRKFLYL